MSMTIKKIDGGFVVTHRDTERVATAEHVANFILQFWPDVTNQLRTKLSEKPPSPITLAADDRIQNY